jgi:ABC-2 type transport system permease protein
MKRPARSWLILVALREIRFFRRDRAGYLLVIVIPLLAFAVLTWTFSSAVVRGLDIVVVDGDRSETSAMIVQSIAAAPGLRIVERANELNRATRAIRSGQAIGAVYIPPRFEHDLLAADRPQIVVFYNAQYFTPGNIASRSLSDSISDALSSLAPFHEVRLPTPGAGLLVVEQYVLTNPALNYAGFLLRAVMPTTLHVIIGIAAVYAVGTEFSRRGRRAWLRCAGGSPLIALVGKLLPLFALFFAMLAVEALILHAGFELPYRGSVPMIVLAAILFIVAYLSLAALLVLLVRDLALGFSLVAIIASPAFGYAGIGMPILAMNDFAQGWGALLPLRWYQQILFDQAARGAPVRLGAGARDPGWNGTWPLYAGLVAIEPASTAVSRRRGRAFTAGRPQARRCRRVHWRVASGTLRSRRVQLSDCRSGVLRRVLSAALSWSAGAQGPDSWSTMIARS